MGWIAREIGIASGVGAAVAAVETVRSGNLGLTPVALVFGVFAGMAVGAVSVAGGSLALRSAQAWPPHSVRCLRQRFATWSAGAVFLFVAMFFVWGATTGTNSAGGAWFLTVSAACAAVTYVCTLLLTPVDRPTT
ncbi:hypothetical protein [Prescottella subtropica]|uniref:hypothetical protein n=1 Tax=Prescottella subtropica TaxID=2545757 RepID=UPI0010F7ADC9|nr:hypothetical protein [Prescottella subtropica]